MELNLSVGRLLLVEDEALLRGLVSEFLTLENFEVVEAEDGQAAVKAFQTRGPFDLVLLDLNLPTVPGVEACRRIKAIAPEQPFLVCSAAILESHVAALEALGVSQTLGKPYHPVELVNRIRSILADQDARRVDGAGARTWSRSSRRPGPPPVHALSETR